MVPRTIRRQLNRLRRRERRLQLAWATARWAVPLALVLAGCCLADWLIDLRRDTPWGLRLAMFIGQLLFWSAAVMTLGVKMSRRPSDTQLALWVEGRVPALRHRLVSAVQLNRPGARTAGMSPELIAAVTREAEQEAAGIVPAQVADGRRFAWSAAVALPLVLAAGLAWAAWPAAVSALLARQFLADRDIPRSVTLASQRPELVVAAGDEAVLLFRVTGAYREDARGEVRVEPDGRPAEQYELVFHSRDGDDSATYLARVPAAAADFSYRAWLQDGRTRRPARVHFEPRPVIQKVEAWVRLPEYIGLRANGQPFEEPQADANIVRRFPSAGARVAVEVQKPIAEATLEVLGPVHPCAVTYQFKARPPLAAHVAAAPAAPLGTGPALAAGALFAGLSPSAESQAPAVRRTVPMAVEGDAAGAVFPLDFRVRPEFLAALGGAPSAGPAGVPWAALALSRGDDLWPREDGYRVVVRDPYGFANQDRQPRAITAGRVEPPDVRFLAELMTEEGDQGPPQDREVEGVPVLLGERIRLQYLSTSPYGLSHAVLRYQVVRKGAADEDTALAGEMRGSLTLPLGARPGAKEVTAKALEEFFVRPGDDPDRVGGTFGVGRYDFETRGIPDGKGGYLQLEIGDRVRYRVEVYGRADPDGQPGRSAVREKEVVDLKGLLAWMRQKEDQQKRLAELERKQRGRGDATSPGERPADKPAGASGGTAERTAPPVNLVFGRAWRLLGVFRDRDGTGHAKVYLPETEPADPGREYDGAGGKVRWQAHESPTDKIDLQKFFHHDEAGVAYAVCWFRCDPRPAVLATGSDDGIKVWLDRKLVVDKAVRRPAVRGEDQTPVTLDDGWHELLVKVDNRFGDWAFYLELLDAPGGKPLAGVGVRLTPPADDAKRFVRDWQVLGPFPNPGDGHSRAYPPEEERRLDLDKEYRGLSGKIRWQPYRGEKDKIDLQTLFKLPSQDSAGVAYAVCWVHCPKKTEAVMATGSDDGLKVWIDRKLVLDRAVAREAEPGSDKTPLELTAGWHEVLVKVDNARGRWAFCFELREASGDRPLDGAKFRITRPD